MPLLVNIRHLSVCEIILEGEISAGELDIDTLDAMIRVTEPLKHDLVVQKTGGTILVRGKLRIGLDCQCVLCLKPFRHQVELSGLLCQLPLQGEERVKVVNDCVDLTPYLREDILLEFPQHPVCKSGCQGLSVKPADGSQNASVVGRAEAWSSAWDELNKLKF
jgi:uncharacterized metal-binding protein YceD (DUF177 family)